MAFPSEDVASPRRRAARLAAIAALAALAVLLSLATNPPLAEGKARMATLMRMEAIGDCPDYTGLSNGFLSSEVYQMGKTQFGRGVFQFNHSYTKVTKSMAIIKKCADRNDPHCEPFQNWRFADESCSLLTMKNMIWSPLFILDPPLSCPIKKGTYKLENATVDLERLKLINFPDKGYWKVSILIEADKIPKAACYYFECSFIKVRV